MGEGIWDDAYDTVSENITNYLDDQLEPGAYTYRVVATNDYADSPPSNEEEVVVLDLPAPPSDLLEIIGLRAKFAVFGMKRTTELI